MGIKKNLQYTLVILSRLEGPTFKKKKYIFCLDLL